MNFNKLIKILLIIGLALAIANFDKTKQYTIRFLRDPRLQIIKRYSQTTSNDDIEEEDEEEEDCNIDLNINDLKSFLDSKIEEQSKQK